MEHLDETSFRRNFRPCQALFIIAWHLTCYCLWKIVLRWRHKATKGSLNKIKQQIIGVCYTFSDSLDMHPRYFETNALITIYAPWLKSKGLNFLRSHFIMGAADPKVIQTFTRRYVHSIYSFLGLFALNSQLARVMSSIYICQKVRETFNGNRNVWLSVSIVAELCRD